MSRLDDPRGDSWQVQVWLRSEDERKVDVLGYPLPAHVNWTPVTALGRSNERHQLETNVFDVLKQQDSPVTCFANTSPDIRFYPQHVYFHVSEETAEESYIGLYLGLDLGEVTPDHFGWWYFRTTRYEPIRQRLGTLEEAVAHFEDYAAIVECGPEWIDRFARETTMPLHLLHTVKMLDDRAKLNDALSRGWYLLSIEHKGMSDERGVLQDREAHYIVGHPLENAR